MQIRAKVRVKLHDKLKLQYLKYQFMILQLILDNDTN